MRRIVKGEELKKYMKETINLICDAVSSTLGPSGNNVLISTSDTSPFITNDGVTIANAISSDDDVVNTILEIIKESSFKTNEHVGDGTTTTLVLLQSIFNNGIRKIENGYDPLLLRKELENSLNIVIDEIKKRAIIPSKKDYISIASISSEDYETGIFLESVFSKMGTKSAIRLEENNTDSTYYEIKKGYNLEVDNIPSVYFKNNNEINLLDVYTLIIKGYLCDLERISSIINEGLSRYKNIVIFADEYSDDVLNNVILYNIQMNKNIYLFKIPDYGSRKEEIIKDISSLTSSKVKNIDYENISFSDLGNIKELIIKKDEITILSDNDIKDRINYLEKEYSNLKNDYEKEFLESRIAKFKNGIATIYVGGKTKTEIKEKIMRFEDALCALEESKDGILLGSGVTLYDISGRVDDEIMSRALKTPLKKIIENSYNNVDVEKEIINSNYKKVYNYILNKFEDESDTTVIDPMNVTIESLKNATSIAGMLLTTNYLVINENIKIEKDIL